MVRGVRTSALHLCWVVGGSTVLAASAGHRLAEQRPRGFVVSGLYGVTATLAGGSVVLLVVGAASAGRVRTAGIALVALVGAGPSTVVVGRRTMITA